MPRFFVPKSSQNTPVPVLGFVQGAGKTLTVDNTARSNPGGFSSEVVTLTATVDIMFERVATSTAGTVNASTGHFWPANTPLDLHLLNDKGQLAYPYIKYTRAGSSSGTIYFSPRE